jgi:hypothetical protein
MEKRVFFVCLSFVYFVFFVFSFAFVCRLFTNEQTNEKRVFSFADVCIESEKNMVPRRSSDPQAPIKVVTDNDS